MATIAVILFPVLVAMVGWFARNNYHRLERDLEAERHERTKITESERAERVRAQEADRAMFLGLFERAQVMWMTALEKEREAAKSDRHEFRNELSKWGASLQNYKLEAQDKFVNTERLGEVLRPLSDSIERFREDMRALFAKVDGKQDKPR